MSEYAETLQNLVADLRIGLSLCTRLPVGPSEPIGEGAHTRLCPRALARSRTAGDEDNGHDVPVFSLALITKCRQ